MKLNVGEYKKKKNNNRVDLWEEKTENNKSVNKRKYLCRKCYRIHNHFDFVEQVFPCNLEQGRAWLLHREAGWGGTHTVRCSKTLPCCWLGISLWNLNTGLHVRQHRLMWKTIVTAGTEALIGLGLLSLVCLEVTFKLSSYFQMVTCLEVTFKQINVGCEKKAYLLWGRFIICKIFK